MEPGSPDLTDGSRLIGPVDADAGDERGRASVAPGTDAVHAVGDRGVRRASPHDRPRGIYSTYFRDLDGHLWELIWNPGFEIATS
jgi:hypothetical protein